MIRYFKHKFMINKYIVLFFIVFTTSVNAQHWGDSLRVARSAFEAEDFELAYEKFLSAQRLAPDHIDLSKDIATAAYRAEDYKTAEQIFEGAAKRDAGDAHKKWLNVGNSQLKQENLEGAIESYKNALRQNPNDDRARYNLAQAKRMLQEQQSQKENQKNEDQNSQNNEDQQQDQQEDQSEDEQQQDGENDQQNDGQQEQEKEPQNSEEENQANSGDSEQQDQSKAQEAQQAKMTEKRIERMLDELLKQEMETKQRVELKTNKKGQGTSKSGKSW